MSDEEEIRHRWKHAKTTPFRASAEEIRSRAETMEKHLRVRTTGGFVVCAIVAASAIWWLTIFPDPLPRIGAVLTIGGIGFLAWRLWLTRSAAGPRLARAAVSGEVDAIASQRAALIRLRDFHRGGELWSRLALLVLGPSIFLAGVSRAHPEVSTSVRIVFVVMGALVVVAVWLNLWLSRRYARRIEELDRLREEA